MTSKERVQLVLRNQTPDRVPFNFWMDRRLLDIYEKKYGVDFRTDFYGADVIEIFADISFPAGNGRMIEGSLWYEEP